jgi:hypothetical protein
MLLAESVKKVSLIYFPLDPDSDKVEAINVDPDQKHSRPRYNSDCVPFYHRRIRSRFESHVIN